MLPSVIKYLGNYSLAMDEAVVVFYYDLDCLQIGSMYNYANYSTQIPDTVSCVLHEVTIKSEWHPT
jgi:hypothetical protein